MSEPENPTTPPPSQQPPYGGYPPPPQQGAPYGGYPPPPPTTSPKNGLGLASLVIAIISLLSVVGGVVLGFVAVILGFLGWGRAKRGEATNGGIAVAGIVLGILSIIEAVVVIGLFIWGFNKVGGTDYIDCINQAGNDQEAVQQCADQFTENLQTQFSITVTTSP
jgi:hypothetical protein